jgi:hypothetical protein
MLEVKVDNQSVNELNKNLKEVGKSLDKIEDNDAAKGLNKDLQDINKTSQGTIKTISSMEDSLKDLNKELENTAIGTDTYRQLEKQVIAVSGELKNLELARESLDNEQFASETKSVAGGLGDMAGGLALVGASSGSVEKIVQTMAQVDGITKAATGAVEAYSSGVKILNAISAKGAKVQKLMAGATAVQATATGAQQTATAGATTTQLGLNAAMLANPIFLLVAAVAALIAAFLIFGGSSRDVAAENDALNESLEKQNAILDRNNEKITRAGQNRLALAKATGASEEEILQIQLDNIDTEEKARKKNIQNSLTEIEKRRKKYKAALEEGEDDLARTIRKEIEATRNKYLDLKALDGQYVVDKKILQAEFDNKQKEADAKEKADTEKAEADSYKKRLDNYKKYLDDRLKAARKIKDLELSLLEEGISKDTQIQQEKTKRAIEDLEKQYGPIRNLNKVQLEELNTLKALITEEGEVKIKAISDKYLKVQLDNRKEFEAELTKVIGTEGASRKDLLDIQYDSELAALQEKVDNEIFTIEEGNRIKAELQRKLNQEKADIDAEYAAREQAAFLELNATDYEGKVAQLEANRLLELENLDLTESEKALIERNYAEQRELLEVEEKDRKIALGQEFAAAAGAALDMVADITNNIFEAQNNKRAAEHAKELENLEEGSEEYVAAKERQAKADEVAAKKQFEINKKIQIAQAVIQGVQSVLAAYSSGLATPIIGPATGAIFAGIAAVVAATNIAKIKSSTFQGGGGSSPAAPSAPSNISSSIQAAQPQLNLFGQGNDENTVGPGAGGDDNQNITVNAEVSVSEINDVQNKVAVQEDRASL